MWRAAKAANRDPWAALGLPELPLTPEVALFILRLDDPQFDKQLKEDLDADELERRVAIDDAWEMALEDGTGYTGERGTVELWPR